MTKHTESAKLTQTGRRFTDAEIARLANAIREALIAAGEDALVMGAVGDGPTLLDGDFDLWEVASRLLNGVPAGEGGEELLGERR